MSNKSKARTTHRLAMLASVAVLALSVPVHGGTALAEQGAQSPQQSTIQPRKQPATQHQQQRLWPQQQAVQKNQAQQQQKQAELQQQQLKAQQQKQAQQSQQLLKQQQQKQAAQEQQLKQQQQNQVQQQQVKQLQQNQAQQQQQLKQLQQNQARQQAEIQRFDWNTYRPGQRPPLWAQYRQNFDPRPYEWARSAPRQYVVRYLPPPGWQYQRWNYGQYYPRPYWQQQSYWLSNYSQYGLQPLPYGYVWVQNGPDALAVDSFSGMILQVIYGLFSGGGGNGLFGGLL